MRAETSGASPSTPSPVAANGEAAYPSQKIDSSRVVSMKIDGMLIEETTISREARRIENSLKASLEQVKIEELRPAIRSKVVEGLIERTLLLEEADRLGVRVTPDQIQSKWEEVGATFPDEALYEAYLADLGMSEQDLRTELAVQLRVDGAIAKRVQEVAAVTEPEVKNFCEQNLKSLVKTNRLRVGHILIQSSSRDNDDVRAAKRQKAQEAWQRLKGGESFAEVALLYSDCESRKRGGELGIIEPGRTEKMFEEIAYSLKEGEFRQVVETRRGMVGAEEARSRPPILWRPSTTLDSS